MMMESEDWQQDLPLTQLQALLDGETDEIKTRPDPDDWGYFLELGPDLGYFSWFANQSLMLRYLVHVEILHAPTSLPERMDYDAMIARLKPLAQAYLTHQDGTAACQAFNACFPDFQLSWLGPFRSLAEPDTAFSLGLLNAFGADPALNPEAFRDFVEHYGL